jgi:allantoate deiminase/N-carbamoyl-L-amino-acid hydrolase
VTTTQLSFGAEIMAMADRLAGWSDAPPGLTCAYLTPAHRATAAQLREWMQAAGMTVHIDAVGNVVGRYPAADPMAKTLITGSHYDTVRNGGRYDGRLGILLPIVAVAALRRSGRRLPFHLEVIGFAEEEGVRFGSTFLGSSAIAGRFDPAALARRDAEGVSMAQAMREAGLDPRAIPALARRPETLLGYVEVHIEQGPVLLDEGLPVGVVTAIAGSSRHMVTIAGEAGHAGTVPMGLRRDAAAAAAELVLYVERRCAPAPTLVGTIGRLDVPHGAINVIPGRAELSLDIRAGDDATRDAAMADVLAEIERIAERRRVAIETVEVLRSPAVPCAPRLQALFAGAIERAGLPVRRLPSGAGHDAVMFNGVTEVGMLFVRCGAGGISHNPRETMTADDADLAARVFLDALAALEARR